MNWQSPGVGSRRELFGVLLLLFGGFGVPIKSVARLGAASLYTITVAKDVNLMPNIGIATPASSAPSDRLALGVGWVRPGVAGIGGTLHPTLLMCGVGCCACFEGNEE